MLRVIIQNNSMSGEQREYDTRDPLATIYDHYNGKLPDNCKIYDKVVSQATEITPSEVSIREDIERLANAEGPIYVVETPGFFLFALGGIFGSLLKILLLGLLSYLLRPKPPKERNTGDQSPNNGLSERVNRARPKERIPDIYGRVRSTPDLLAPSWYRFEANRQVEYSYMCVGRGEFQISDMKDGTTPIDDIAALSVEVYGPDQSPNMTTGKVIQESIGRRIGQRVWGVQKSNSITGQILRAPDATSIDGNADIAFNFPDNITINSSGDVIAMDDYFTTGDPITITGSLSQGNTIDLDGTYTVYSATAGRVTLVRPELVNTNWSTNGNFNTPFTDADLTTDSDKWVGPFIVEKPWIILANFVAPQGVYKDDGEDQIWHVVEIETEMWEIDENDNQVGVRYTTRRFLEGSRTLTNERSESSFFEPPSVGTPAQSKEKRWKVRARRITPKGSETDIRFIEQVQWDSLFALEYIDMENFGNVTTIMTRTPATSGALSVRERKFNCDAHRLTIGRNEANVTVGNPYGFTANKVPTQSVGLLIRDIALDPKLGSMTEAELDYDNLFTAVAYNQNYFGTIQTRNFGYTFDEKNTSAEEMIQTIAQATFMNAYRQGSMLKLQFERKSQLSSLLFNHRNKIPNSEVRDVRFGTNDDHDGVSLDWVDPTDGATETYTIPYDGSANNPKSLEIPGVANKVQAHMHAWREFQKIKHRHVAVEFDATAEANTLILNERVLVADNTRGDTYDGYVTYQNGTTLGLSQPFDYRTGDASDYTIYLQHYDGTVEMLPVSLSTDQKSVTLNNVPRLPIVVDREMITATKYIIAESSQVRPLAFLIQEIEPKSIDVLSVNAVNYDDRYYEHDEDFIDGFFDDAEVSHKIIFRETFESLFCPPGEFRHHQDPGGFTSNAAIEIQNNIPGVGPARQGSKHCELDGQNEIWVDLPTDTTKSYDLMMFYSPRASVPAADNEVEIHWNGNLITTLVDDGTNNQTVDWRSIFWNLPTVTGTTTQLRFKSTSAAGVGVGGLIDDVRIRETTN